MQIPLTGVYEIRDETSKLKAIVSKARRYGYLPVNFTAIEELFESNDKCRFTATLYNPQHFLRQLPPPKQTGYNLRSRGNGLTLPELQFDYLRIQFIHRTLYRDLLILSQAYKAVSSAVLGASIVA